MKYRDLKPDELVEEGDEFEERPGKWVPSNNWIGIRLQTARKYRRPVTVSIQDRLRALAVEMFEVALVMLDDDQSETMRSKGAELKGAAAMVSEWLESMRAEETIQGFVDERKL